MNSRRALAWLVVVGCIVRVAVWIAKGGFQYPDEIFQQVEPAHHLRTGVGWFAWEFRRGLRSWLTPALYAGMLEIFDTFGWSGLTAWRAVTLHNALWGAAIIPAGWRIGRALAGATPASQGSVDHADHADRAGLVTATLFALWPTLAYFAPHTLSETPSVVLLAWGFAAWLELWRGERDERKAALGMGFWFGLAGLVRFTSGLHMLVPLAWLVWRRRWRAFGWVLLGALPGVFLLGAADWATWGRPFHSAVQHVLYNYFEDGASDHGTSPWHAYLTGSYGLRFGPLLPIALGLLLAGAARAPVVALAWAVPTVLLSTVAHKEERFVLNGWPLLLGLIGLGLVLAVHRFGPGERRRSALALAVGVALLSASNLYGTLDLPWRWRSEIFAAQSEVGQRADSTGLLLDDRQHMNGGYFVLDRNIPQVAFAPRHLPNPLFNYAALKAGSPDEEKALAAGFVEEKRFGDFVLLRRSVE